LNADSLKNVLTQLEEESPKHHGEFSQPAMQSPSGLISTINKGLEVFVNTAKSFRFGF